MVRPEILPIAGELIERAAETNSTIVIEREAPLLNLNKFLPVLFSRQDCETCNHHRPFHFVKMPAFYFSEPIGTEVDS